MFSFLSDLLRWFGQWSPGPAIRLSGGLHVTRQRSGAGRAAVAEDGGGQETTARTSYRQSLFVEHDLGESSGSTVAAARRAAYPWSEQMARKMLRNVEKRGVQAARNAPSEDSKCWQRVELGIH